MIRLILIGLTFLFTSNFCYGINAKTYITKKAKIYLPMIKQEQQTYFPDISIPWYFGGLIEQESCIHLTHKRCFDPSSELLTSREQGVGFGQITRAYRTDGSLRFDALDGMKKRYTNELKELSWKNVKTRPDLQARTMVLMVRDMYKTFYSVKDPIERLKFSDAAYNGGPRDTIKERTACGLKSGCDPQIWFDNVENVCVKSKKPLYGNRNACMINREHPELIFHTRMHKYKPYF